MLLMDILYLFPFQQQSLKIVILCIGYLLHSHYFIQIGNKDRNYYYLGPALTFSKCNYSVSTDFHESCLGSLYPAVINLIVF